MDVIVMGFTWHHYGINTLLWRVFSRGGINDFDVSDNNASTDFEAIYYCYCVIFSFPANFALSSMLIMATVR